MRTLPGGRAAMGRAPRGGKQRRGPQNGEKSPKRVCVGVRLSLLPAVIWPHNFTPGHRGAPGAAPEPLWLHQPPSRCQPSAPGRGDHRGV